MGLARLSVMRKDWADAERRYADIAGRHPDSKYLPEAIYWQGVSRYSGTHEHNALGETAETLNDKFADSQWAMRSLPWLPAEGPAA